MSSSAKSALRLIPILLLPAMVVQSAERILSPLFISHIRQKKVTFDLRDDLCSRILADYGSIFTANPAVQSPPTYMFKDQSSVQAWQSTVPHAQSDLAGLAVTLQARAWEEFEAARKEALAAGLSLHPAGKDSSIRTYEVTVALWNTRLEPGLAHWTEAGKLSKSAAEALRMLPPNEQIQRVLELEERGLFFSKDFQKSILYSVAPPGTSQHLSLFALDVAEHENPAVREILARHGWFQTVYSDLPHFTFLGQPESLLPSLGLVKKINAGHVFWIVDAKGTRGEELLVPEVTEECPF